MFLGQTDVNVGITETLRTSPDAFWYFNNGITALALKVKKKPIGGSSREMGVFECDGVSIVNGVQTVGAIAAAAASYPTEVSRARVMIRFISLEGTPEDLSKRITQFTNTQNRIERRDFVALDPEQERIRTELKIDEVEYVYKSGDVVPPGQIGFDLVEAAVALACAQADITLAVQAKREIGKLWDDITKPPYKTLFNPSLNGQRLWGLVKILRSIEAVLIQEQKNRQGRDRLFAVHGNRFVTWLVMKVYADVQPVKEEEIQGETLNQLNKLAEVANATYPDTYLASLFKNVTKCKDIVTKMGILGISS
jgi:hypothetical protein